MSKNFREEYEKQLSYFIVQRKDLKKIDLILNHCNFSGITKNNVKEIFIIFILYHFLAIFFTITSGLLIIYLTKAPYLAIFTTMISFFCFNSSKMWSFIPSRYDNIYKQFKRRLLSKRYVLLKDIFDTQYSANRDLMESFKNEYKENLGEIIIDYLKNKNNGYITNGQLYNFYNYKDVDGIRFLNGICNATNYMENKIKVIEAFEQNKSIGEAFNDVNKLTITKKRL